MVVAVSLNPAHLKRLQTIVELEGTGILEEETLDNRFILYYAAIQATMEHWLVGLGPGGFMTWLRDEIGFGPNNPHNLTLLLTSEFGVVGLGIYGAFIWATYRRAREAIRLSLANNDIEGASYSAAAISSLVGLLIYAQFNPLFRASMIYIAAGLASVALYLARRHYGSGELDSAQPPAEVEGADDIERESAT
jgi:O-antigen ligase